MVLPGGQTMDHCMAMGENLPHFNSVLIIELLQYSLPVSVTYDYENAS